MFGSVDDFSRDGVHLLLSYTLYLIFLITFFQAASSCYDNLLLIKVRLANSLSDREITPTYFV